MRGPLDEAQRRVIEERLGHRFASADLLEQAFTHASYANQLSASSPDTNAEGGPPADYDRLEYLGDAVVGMLLAEIAYRRAPRASAGDLTRRRAQLARRSTLAAAAERIDLGSFVRISEGEARQGGAKRRRLLADLFEAMIGAIYLDGGLDAARRVLERHLDLEAVFRDQGGPLVDDPKSELQELLQGDGRPPPRYGVIEISGPPHAPLFLVEVEVEGAGAFRGAGGSRREAEREAARVALSSCTKP